MRIAVVGTGISGLVCAHLLGPHHELTVFEADSRPGGHSHTASVVIDDRAVSVDTGFLVYNERTYPGLARLFAELRIATKPSDMSFSVSDEMAGLEYRGTSPSSVFAQRRNLVRPEFLRMLVEVVRFHRAGRHLLLDPRKSEYTLADMMAEGRWSKAFVDWYLLPLGSSIWSADPATFTRMPATTLLRFFDRHGMLSIGNKPAWRTVEGGSARYVEAILDPVRRAGRLRLATPVGQILRTDEGVDLRCGGASPEQFDHVIVATHSDQALGMIADASRGEKEVLGDIRYQSNQVSLHTDARLMPANRRAWAAWNYHRPATASERVTMTYDLNRLQGLESSTPVLVTLNRDEEIDPAKLLRTYEYAHPVIDTVAVTAQARHSEISGPHRVSFCGAYWGSGFHEDGLQSALAVCAQLGVRW
jgi:predicted NAD/FAD-binding protein